MKIGMIGGLGPESTVDYYKRIIGHYQAEIDAENYPEMLINNVNMTEMLRFVENGDTDGLTQFLLRALHSLSAAGADFAFIASNTPHLVFDRLRKASPLPLVSIVESARAEAESLGLRRLGLLGTLFTMRSSFYQEVFDRAGIALVLPNEAEQQYIQRKLFTEIERGVFLDETRTGLLAIIRRLIEEASVGGVVLGCTELPLILPGEAFGIPLLNTTESHVRRIIETCKAHDGIGG